MKLQLALCGLLSGVTSSAAFDVNALDAAILHDLLHSYTDNQPSTCNVAEGSTSFSFDWPGVDAASEWYPDFQGFEEDLFLAAMSHDDPTGSKSWTIRIGQGGNMYSHFVRDMHGETMPPQAHVDAPWIDEVHQSVSVNNYLNNGAGRCNGQNCPANFVHGAGTYQRDDPYTNVPFFSQSVAKYCSGNSCIFAAWGQQAHLATIFTSSIMFFNKFTNCGNGIIEHTQMIHNFAPANTVAPELVDQTYFNTPWSGVRRSKLPYALEPDYTTGTLSYDDPDTVDYCPLCGWGNDAPGGPQDMGNGRCARAYNQNTGGYTTFAAPGLFVNRETSLQQYLWCRKPDADCALNPSTCMARPTECYNEDGSPKTGYTPIQLQVNANSTPQCKGHIGLFEGYMTVQCKFHTTGFGNCGTYLYAGTSADTCAPWLSGGTMGLFREDTNEGMTIPYVRHWSWSASDQYMYFSVYSQDQTEAINMVNSMFDNTVNPDPLPIRFETFPPGETFPGADYNPGALDSVTFVYGKDSYSATPGSGRRRMGSSSRDYTVFTINWMQSGAKLTPGDTYSNRSFMFASDLASAKPTADSLLPHVVPDKIFDTRWNPRAINIYKSGTSFDAVAASSVEGTTTTCSSATANLECSGYSTPKARYVPFFHITCGASSYLGPDPYHFTPGNGDWFTFPGMSNDNTKKIRSYACVGEVESVRPTWKLIGWFDPTSCTSLGSGLVFDDNICTESQAQPSYQPSLQPSKSSQPSSEPSPSPVHLTSPPTAQAQPQPSYQPSLQPSESSQPSSEPSTSPLSLPSMQPSLLPSLTTNPSSQPSSSSPPSFRPSMYPSNPDPTFEASYTVTVTLNTNTLDVTSVLMPDAESKNSFLDALIDVLTAHACPDDPALEACDLEITHVNGEPIAEFLADLRRNRLLQGRRLSTALQIDFIQKLIAICNTECTNADSVAELIYTSSSDGLESALQDGSFTQGLINDLSATGNVQAILDAAVVDYTVYELIVAITALSNSWYPDWDYGEVRCKNDGDAPVYMSIGGNWWYEKSKDECCKKYFSWSYDECAGASAEVVLGYYPVWGNVDPQCDSGDPPSYMRKSPKGWIFDTAEKCCENYFGWDPNCVVNSGGVAPVDLTADLYYADWANSNTCVSDGNAPGYAKSNPKIWMYDTLLECCKANYFWGEEYVDCITSEGADAPTSSPIDETWYADFVNQECVRSCEGDKPCGGVHKKWNILHSTRFDCCDEHFWWKKECKRGY